jgi:hypothetical protein
VPPAGALFQIRAEPGVYSEIERGLISGSLVQFEPRVLLADIIAHEVLERADGMSAVSGCQLTDEVQVQRLQRGFSCALCVRDVLRTGSYDGCAVGMIVTCWRLTRFGRLTVNAMVSATSSGLSHSSCDLDPSSQSIAP